MTTDVALTYVVAGDKLEHVLRSIAACLPGAELVVAWTGPPQHDERLRVTVTQWPGTGRVLTLHPWNAAYAWNRGLAAAHGEDVLLLAQGAAPRRWRRLPRLRLLAEGGLDQSLPRFEVLEAVLRLHGADRSAAVVRRTAHRLHAPLHRLVVPTSLPVELRPLVDAPVRPLEPSPPPKTHLMHTVGDDRVLHVYVGPSDRLRRALSEREAVRRTAGSGVPKLHAAAEGRDAVWVLEDRLVGTPPTGQPAMWFPQVAAWLVRLAGPPGPPLAADPAWAAEREAAVAAVPGAARSEARAALAEVERWPARCMHGDLQPKNVVMGTDGIGAVDWEGVWHRGVPGLDLVYLACLARGQLDAGDLLTLARGQDPPGLPVLSALRGLDVHEQAVPTLVRACLAVWTLGERRRNARIGAARPASEAFTALWHQLG